MPYITLQLPDAKLPAKYALAHAVLIGRSPDCDIRIHDILASREHCSLEPGGDGWVVNDQKSRNGTALNGEKISSQKLKDNDTLVVGKTRITFHDEVLIDVPSPTREYSPSDRPANPMEALSSTMADFVVEPKFQAPVERPIIRAMPRPMPVANHSPLPQSAALNLPASLSEGDSSPTWATKRNCAPASARLMAVEGDLLAPPEPAAQLTPWGRRARTAIVEVIVAGAITGAAVVGTVAAMTR